MLSGCSAVRVRHSQLKTASHDRSATLELGAFEKTGSERWGKYVAGVTFFVYEVGDTKPFETAQSSSKGPLAIDGLIAKRYEIAFEGPGFDPISKVVRLRPGTITYVDLDLIMAQKNPHGAKDFGNFVFGTLAFIAVVALYTAVYACFFIVLVDHH